MTSTSRATNANTIAATTIGTNKSTIYASIFENLSGSLFVETKADRGHDVVPACPIQAVENWKHVALGLHSLRE